MGKVRWDSFVAVDEVVCPTCQSDDILSNPTAEGTIGLSCQKCGTSWDRVPTVGAVKPARGVRRGSAIREQLHSISQIEDFDEVWAIGQAAKGKDKNIRVAAFLRALEIRPDSVPVYNALGAASRDRGNLQKAQDAYDRALSIQPNNVSLVGLASVARDREDHEKAISLYLEVLEKEPLNPYALNGIGGVYSDIGRYHEAEDAFSVAAEQPIGTSTARSGLQNLKRLYKEQGNREGVLRIDRWLTRFG